MAGHRLGAPSPPPPPRAMPQSEIRFVSVLGHCSVARRPCPRGLGKGQVPQFPVLLSASPRRCGMTQHAVSIDAQTAAELCVLVGGLLPGTRPPLRCRQKGACGPSLATDEPLPDVLPARACHDTASRSGVRGCGRGQKNVCVPRISLKFLGPIY